MHKKFLSPSNSKRLNIGFLLPGKHYPYFKSIASIRLRVYDVINYLNKTENIQAELYNVRNRYEIIVFQKYFNGEAFEKILKIKEKETNILLDINVNYFENFNTNLITVSETNNIMRFGKEVDGFVVSSQFLYQIVQQYFPTKKNVYIPENIDEKFFTVRKVHTSKSSICLLYVGYELKAKEIYLIKEVLENLGLKYNLELIFICEKDPKIKIKNVKRKYVKYNHKTIQKQLLQGDIKIAPRDLTDRYNLGHSFTKIGYPMAVGIPVVASPLDSYKNSPALLCNTNEEWEKKLQTLINNHRLRNTLAEQGFVYCKQYYTMENIGKQYVQYFNELYS